MMSEYPVRPRALTGAELLYLPRDVEEFGPTIQHVNDLLATVDVLQAELAVYRQFAIDQWQYLKSQEDLESGVAEVNRPPIRYCAHNHYDPVSRCVVDREDKCGLLRV